MLVIFGANGRMGRALVEESLRQGWTVRAVVRDDRDGRGLDQLIDVAHISYADADHSEAVAAVLDGATHVISAINARAAGHGSPRYSNGAGANIVKAAVEAGVENVLHFSVVGSFRWSPNPLNRRSFRLDREVRVLKDLPWSMVRVSCFHDEIIDGYVRPPDGGRPHQVIDSARYSPLSRRDAARMIVDYLPQMLPSRTMYMGGPDTFVGSELRALLAPWVEPGGGRRTRYGALPPGDMSVSREQTRVMVPTEPIDRLADALDPAWAPPPPPEPEEVYRRVDPGPHPADQGRDIKPLRPLGTVLRRVVHDQLVADLAHLGIATEGVELDFRSARPRRSRPASEAHDGSFADMTGVKAVSADGELLHRGAVVHLRDTLAEEFRCWWEREDRAVPEEVWTTLDMGVRRRMAKVKAFARDARVQAFADGHEATAG
jgi:uncharacterized protein YbjT (DUF2867 family)